MCRYRYVKFSCNCTGGDIWEKKCSRRAPLSAYHGNLLDTLCQYSWFITPELNIRLPCWICITSVHPPENDRVRLKIYSRWERRIQIVLGMGERQPWFWKKYIDDEDWGLLDHDMAASDGVEDGVTGGEGIESDEISWFEI